ncbi:MFS transporter [Intrasporangium sp.]|uniref:MFS transporter n=1 Tax=Intrasporangium sp. TaxID=1925024 RepID=UPI002D78E2FD|nr:MFS transporter [Intrasporangium sp.]
MAGEHRLLTLAILALVTIIAFEAMAVSTAMPVVARELDAVRSYGLAFSFLLTAELLGIVLSGLWSDRRGPLPVLVAGQLLFAVGCVTAGLAVGFPMLLLGRLVAGLGSGLDIVAIYVVIGRSYPEALRPKVFSWISAAWVLPSLAGPPVAGLLTTTWSWRWVFLVVVAPIAVTFAVVLSQRGRIVGDAPRPAGDGSQRRVAWLGLAVAVAAGAMQVGAERLVPLDPGALLLTAAGLAAVALVFPRLVPHGTLWMARGLPAVLASRFLLTAAFNGAMTFVPLMLVASRGLTPALSGLMLSIGALGWSLGSFLQGREPLAAHKAALVSTGGACLSAGTAALAVVAALGLHHVVVGVASALCGLGMGLAMSATSVLSLSLSPLEQHGSTASSLNLADVLGSVMGISVAGAVFAALHDPAGADVAVFVLMWSVLAGVAALVVPGGQRTRPGATMGT